MATKPSFSVTYLYPRKDLTRFDLDYYLQQHLPKTSSLWTPLGLTGCIVSEPETDDYVLIVVTLWKDKVSWDAAKDGEAAQKLVADVKNFTNVIPAVIPGKLMN
jgi:hypothetical protein